MNLLSPSAGWKHRTGLTDWTPPDALPPTLVDPGLNPKEAQVGFDDKDWWSVQLPHDGLIATAPSSKACPDGCSGRSFIPRKLLWYRKEFTFPKSWTTTADSNEVWLDFDGSFRNTTVWLNGKLSASHVCGYTPFRLRLDNITGIDMAGTNTIAVFVDPDNGDSGGKSHGSGWWYEGGGLYRHVTMVRAGR